jgi:D-glycero-D-manno-heptose 1,7-bisphosphate phosphatase
MSLYIFDKDKTLLRHVRSRFLFRRPPLKPEEQILRNGVFEKLAELRAAGHQIAIATNQSAVAHGLITLAEAEELAKNCAAKIGGVAAWRLSPYDPRAKKRLDGNPNPYARDDETRKPHPGMIRQLMEELGSSPKETFMVGDKKMDKKSAKAAGISFIDEKKFFKK